MNTFPGFAALVVVAFSAVSLVACAAPGTASDGTDTSEATETAAQSLLLSCDGTYTRRSDDGKGELRVVVGRDQDEECTVAGYPLGADHTFKGTIAGKPFVGTWNGDSTAFVMCTDADCALWSRSVTAGER